MNVVFIKEKLSEGQSFETIYKEAKAIEDAREDFFVHNVAANLKMNDSDGSLSWNYETPDGRKTMTQKPSEWALSQLSTKIGMPSGYAQKCIDSKHTALAADNVNTWLADQSGSARKRSTNYLIRSYNGGVDGILSDRYARFDTTRILDACDATMDIKDYHVVGSYVSDERMHVRLIKDKMLDVDGEDLYPGIFIDSSDVGRTSLNVRFGIWKKVCTNGMCISKVGGMLYHQRHMGIEADEVISELKKNLVMVPSLIAKSEDIIKASRVEKLDLKDEKVFERLVEQIRKQALVSQEEALKVIETAKTHYDVSRWGIANAMTLMAQKYELDKRIQIEDAAGKLITMAIA